MFLKKNKGMKFLKVNTKEKSSFTYNEIHEIHETVPKERKKNEVSVVFNIKYQNKLSLFTRKVYKNFS